MPLGLFRIYGTGNVRETKLRPGDVIGYDVRRSARAIRIFRFTKKGERVIIFFREDGSPLLEKFRQNIDGEESFHALCELMAAVIKCKAVKIPCSKLPEVAWAYQVCK
jgi:hypothetical protein